MAKSSRQAAAALTLLGVLLPIVAGTAAAVLAPHTRAIAQQIELEPPPSTNPSVPPDTQPPAEAPASSEVPTASEVPAPSVPSESQPTADAVPPFTETTLQDIPTTIAPTTDTAVAAPVVPTDPVPSDQDSDDTRADQSSKNDDDDDEPPTRTATRTPRTTRAPRTTRVARSADVSDDDDSDASDDADSSKNSEDQRDAATALLNEGDTDDSADNSLNADPSEAIDTDALLEAADADGAGGDVDGADVDGADAGSTDVEGTDAAGNDALAEDAQGSDADTFGTDADGDANGVDASDNGGVTDAADATADSSGQNPDQLGLVPPGDIAFPVFEAAEHVAPVQRVQTIAVSAVAVMAAAAAPAAAAARAGRSGVANGSRRATRSAVDAKADAAPSSKKESAAGDGSEREYSEVYTGDAAAAAVALIDPGRGDRSRSWRAPLTDQVDGASRSVPSRLSRFSPLLSALVADGTWARAMFGSVSAILPIGGIALGIAAGIDANGSFLPPSLLFVGVLMVLGILDAGAGFFASIAFAATTVAIGGIPTASQFRAMAGLVVLWFAPIIIAGATRPLRREYDPSIDTRLDRLGDVLIGSMTAVWCSQGFTYGQNALTGLQLPIADNYVRLGWIAFAALVARYVLESIVDRWYPVRLAATDPGESDTAPLVQRYLSLALRGAFYLFVAAGFFPIDAKILFATAVMLFGVFGYWEGFTERFPNFGRLYRWMPVGLPLAFILIVATDRITAWLNRVEPNPNTRLVNTFVFVTVPVLIATLAAVFGRDGERPPLRTWHRLAAAPLLILTAHYMFGLFLDLPVPSLFRA